MNNNTQQKLTELFNRFANEEQSSSFAVENLLNKVFRILQEEDAKRQGFQKMKADKEEGEEVR